jgi:hypothetical protein
MAGKSYIKVGYYDWDRIKKMYIKTGGQTWTAIRKTYVKTSTGWRKVFDTASNRPFIAGNDIPKIRLNTFRTGSSYNPTGTADDPVDPVVEAPPVQQMGPSWTSPTYGWPYESLGRHLWGYDGTWTSGNGSSMTFTYTWLYNLTGNSNDNTAELNATSTTGRTDMLTNLSSHLGQSDGDYFDKNFLTFRVTATNSAGSASSESAPVYIVRESPTGSITMSSSGTAAVNLSMSASFTYSNSWYNKTNVSNSYIEWFAVDNLGDPLTNSNRVQIDYLSSISVTGTNTKSGTTFHTPTLTSKYYYVKMTLNNSSTQNAVIAITGFTPKSSVTSQSNKTVRTGAAVATSPTSITATNNGSYTTVSISWSGASNASYYRVRWVGYQDTSVDPAFYYDKQITASSSTSGSWNWGPSDPDKDGAVPYPGTAYYYHVSSSADGTTWSPYTVSATAVGTLVVPAPTIISGYEPVNTNTSNTRNFSVTTGSWNNSPTTYSYQWKAFTYLSYPPYISTINVGTNSSSYSGISTYDNYSIYCVVTATNAGGSGTATSNSITQVSPGVAPSGGSVTLSPSGTQQAGTTITANVSAMSGTATISYTTTIRKKTGSAPTSNTDGTEVASGTGTGNVASHTITTTEASGTPDQFRAFTTGTNATGSNTVSSNTVISTPAVVTQYTISWNAFGGTVSPTSNTVNSGTTVSAPTPTRSGYTFLYWRDSTNAFNYAYQINPGGSWTVTSNITFYAWWQVASVAPATPTGVSVSGSGVVSWSAVSGADYYEVLNYTDRTGSPSNTNNRLGPYNTTVYGTSLQLGSSQGYSGSNNYARAQVRAWNNAGQVSTYSSWYPSSTTYV